MPGQTVDEVEIERLEASLANPESRAVTDLLRLNPVNPLLDGRLEVLDAEGRAIGAELAKRLHLFERQPARIQLDADFGVRIKREVFAKHGCQACDLNRRKKVGCPPSEVNLDHAAVRVQFPRGQSELFVQIVEVRIRAPPAAPDDGGATTKPTQGLAERQMEIERQRPCDAIVGAKVQQQRVPRKLLGELHRRRIGGVARAGQVVLADQIEIDVKSGAHSSVQRPVVWMWGRGGE